MTHRLVAASQPVRLELAALGTWRNAHGERFASGAPDVEGVADGYVFEGAYRVEGPGFVPAGEWYTGPSGCAASRPTIPRTQADTG